jgi:hypothetical protein
MRWLDDAEYDIVKEQAETNDAKNAIVMVGNLTPSAAPMQIAGKPPAKLAAPAQSVGDMADEDEAEEDPPARVAKPAVKKAKPTPAPVVEEEDTAPEPEVRKTAAKPTAVPSGKSKLADIVSDWDDE